MNQPNDVLEKAAAPRRTVEPASAPEPEHGLVEPLDAFLPPPEDFLDDESDTVRYLDSGGDPGETPDSLLASFGNRLSVVVIGATGGIGAALTSSLQRDPAVARVYALSRRGSVTYGSKVAGGEINLAQERSIERAATAVAAGGPISLVIVATGYLDQGDMDGLGDGWRSLDGLDMANAFQVNAIGPALVAKHFLPRMAEGRKSVFAVLADRPTQPTTAAQHAYRASKAALDSVVHSLAGELAERGSPIVCAGMYPGVVDTSFSELMLHDSSDDALSPELAAERVIRLADRAASGDSGRVLAWDR